MPVSESPPMERTPQMVLQHLAMTSLIGGALLLLALWFILAGLPWSWEAGWASAFAQNPSLKSNAFLSGALLILVELITIGAVCYVGFQALQKQTQPGVRAGIFFFAIAIFIAMWIGILVGRSLEDQFVEKEMVGWVIVAGVVAAIIVGVGYVYLKVPGWFSFLETVEQQGWFTGRAYKGSQGLRVRRGTIFGILAIGVSGIVVLAMRKSFGVERADIPREGFEWIVPAIPHNDWEWILPFSDLKLYIPLMFKLQITMPILLFLLLIWMAWRIVNVPAFGDFLIATEAEMNKVSWTNRRRLFQDTIVVLVTVFLFTGFLFVVDVVWIKVLSMPGVRVLLIDPHAEQMKQQQKAEW